MYSGPKLCASFTAFTILDCPCLLKKTSSLTPLGFVAKLMLLLSIVSIAANISDDRSSWLLTDTIKNDGVSQLVKNALMRSIHTSS
jgi:hypothetical protein